ncbi:DUF3180 domain-containing protein [Nesterenkonia sp. HG001]|uniref:DUF3180 domain-containing protein n=1 Tax=Nesterenkonia sp. HG001 TaxID=2983207 RepID=UPI002AC7C1D0|nr:DUF3180 domain-containing protein [Nesterenkonia sp. HG001]MDZ5078204.1 DUF3180 domain-containing protein [Nesterenkonia sp. HG001]
MTRLQPMWLLIIAAGSALVGFLATVLMVSNGYGSPVLTPVSLITLGGVGLVVLGLGIVVWVDQRRLESDADQARRDADQARRDADTTEGPAVGGQPQRRGPRPGRRLHPLEAARVVVAAQACGYAGAVIAGWHGGALIDLTPAAGLAAPNASAALLMIIGGLAWVIIGFVVEHLCRLPPNRGGDGGSETRGGTYRDFGPEPGAASGTAARQVVQVPGDGIHTHPWRGTVRAHRRVEEGHAG